MADAKGGKEGQGGAAAGAISSDTMEDMRRLKIWEKLRKGELHTITKENVAEFFRVLDETDRGEISVEELRSLRLIPDLDLSEEDIEALVKDGDKDQSGKLSQDELYKALTQGDVAFNIVKRSKSRINAKSNWVDREMLLDWLRDEYETMSALCSLPTSIAFFLVFFIMIITHLDISSAWSVQNGLKAEIMGEGFPSLDTNQVHDVMSLYGWMNTSFVDCVFKNDLVYHPYPGRVASYNQIIGGVKLERTSTVPVTCPHGDQLNAIFDPSHGGRCHKLSDTTEDSKYLLYQENRTDIVQQLRDIAESNWLNQNTTKLDIGILLLNMPMNMFTAFHMQFMFLPDGLVKIVFDLETFKAEPYADPIWIIPDVIFILLLLRMLSSEMKELVPACLNGVDGFIDYMGFWNMVDWVSMLMALAVAIMWMLFCLSVSGPFQDLINELPMQTLNDHILENRSWFSPAELEEFIPHADLHSSIERVHEKMDTLKVQHAMIRQVLFFYSFVLLMKFFKAFRANPRLNIVIQTFTSAFIDLIHFFLVFTLIFFVFSGSAHIIFGASMKQFSGQGTAAMMCFRILFGEFEVEEMVLAAGPLAWLWFVSFQLMVFLILLNLLLAIIVDSYTAAKAKYQDPITIWAQVNKARKTLRETRGHLDQWYLICEFEDDEYPAHPLPRVTSKSLRKSFAREKMTKNNADYCVRKTLEYQKMKEGDLDFTLTDAIREISKLGVQTLKIADQTETTLDMMKEDRRKPAESRLKAIWEGDDPDKAKLPTMPGLTVSSLPPGPQMMTTPHGHAQSQMMALTGPMGAASPHGTFSSPSPLAAGSMQAASPFGDLPGSVTDSATMQGFRAASPQKVMRTSSSSAMSKGLVVTAPGPHGGHHAGETMAMMQHMHTSMDAMRAELFAMTDSVAQHLESQRKYTLDREQWLENRLNQLERRSEKVERASDRLTSNTQAWDFDDMGQNLRKILVTVTKLASNSKGPTSGTRHDTKQSTVSRNTLAPSVISGSTQEATPQGDDDALATMELSELLEKRMGHVDKQLGRLLGFAEEATESRKLLWKIEQGVCKLRGGVAAAGGSLSPTQSGLREAASLQGTSRTESRQPVPNGLFMTPGAPVPNDVGAGLHRHSPSPSAAAPPTSSPAARAALAKAAGARAAGGAPAQQDTKVLQPVWARGGGGGTPDSSRGFVASSAASSKGYT